MTSAATARRTHRTFLWPTVWRVAVALTTGVATLLVSFGYDLTVLEDAGQDTEYLAPWVFLDLLLGLIAIGLIPLRRRAPLVTVLIVGCLAAFSALALGAMMLTLISLGTRRRPVEIVTAFLGVLAATVVGQSLVPQIGEPVPVWQIAVLIAVALLLLLLVGLYIGGRRELVMTLRERSDRLLTEQSLREEQARSAERIRIAREMHDVLAHRLSLVALHSGALAYRDDLSRDETAETAGVVRDNAHLALSELRDVLGALRDPHAPQEVVSSTSPQPTLARLDALVSENREAGAVIHLVLDHDCTAEEATVPVGQSRHAYRIVQEALTNARRHAPSAPVFVRIATGPGGRLEIAVQNEAEGPAGNPGHGLNGIAERARLAGGDASWTHDGSLFVLIACLPWSA